MGPNDVEVVRVFTRRVKATIADITLAKDEDFEVVVEAEAGRTIFGGGGRYRVALVLRDLTANNDVPFTANFPLVGLFGDPGWAQEDNKFVFTVSSADLGNRGDHILIAYATLLAGNRDFDASLTAGPLVMIEP
jgi:hypothetical protein